MKNGKTNNLFSSLETIEYEGPATENVLAYRWYDADRIIAGKPLKDHLRFAVAYWHSLAMTGSDPFGGPAMDRPWMGSGDPIASAKMTADAAFGCTDSPECPTAVLGLVGSVGSVGAFSSLGLKRLIRLLRNLA